MDAIFDLDGTLADCEHRRHHITSKPKSWDKFFAGCADDPVIEPVAKLARLLMLGNRVIHCSGRPERCRDDTTQWLQRMYGKTAPEIVLYMRKDGDHRPDVVVKEELLAQIREDGYQPELVFDDRASVVAMWRKNGLICAQMADALFFGMRQRF